jgi:hypothetical protein
MPLRSAPSTSSAVSSRPRPSCAGGSPASPTPRRRGCGPGPCSDTRTKPRIGGGSGRTWHKRSHGGTGARVRGTLFHRCRRFRITARCVGERIGSAATQSLRTAERFANRCGHSTQLEQDCTERRAVCPSTRFLTITRQMERAMAEFDVRRKNGRDTRPCISRPRGSVTFARSCPRNALVRADLSPVNL